MRKLVMTTVLGCTAMATAADAQIVRAGHLDCAYGTADRELVVEVAGVYVPRWRPLPLA